jgi:hypothetical protein
MISFFSFGLTPCYGFSQQGNDGGGKILMGSPFYTNNDLHQSYGGFGAVSVKFIFSASST